MKKNNNVILIIGLCILVIIAIVFIYFTTTDISNKMINSVYVDGVHDSTTEIIDKGSVELTTEPSVKPNDKVSTNQQSDKEESNIKETPEKSENQIDKECISYDENGALVYHIQKGDTLSAISDDFGYSVDELAEYNKIRDVNRIYADSAMRIPQE